MVSLRRTLIITGILLSMISGGVVMSSCRSQGVDEIQTAPENSCQVIYGDEENMDTVIEGAETVFTLPLIDISAPTKIETATFALG
jgi:hypothetical protein